MTHEERMDVMREVVVWLREAPQTMQVVHVSGAPVGLANRKRPLTPDELADELEQQIADGTA